jgi:hypothetical protein
MQIAVTMLSTACALLAVFAAVLAHRSSEAAHADAQALRESRGRLIAMEHSLEVLDQRVKRVLGTVYEARSRARSKAFDGQGALPMDDEELDALLALQSAKPVQPG